MANDIGPSAKAILKALKEAEEAVMEKQPKKMKVIAKIGLALATAEDQLSD